jgi:hypothetical protein
MAIPETPHTLPRIHLMTGDAPRDMVLLFGLVQRVEPR